MSTQKITIIFDHIMALDHSRSGPENRSGRIFFVRHVYLTKSCQNLGACKSTFHTLYTSHLRWNSTMRRCFYHTDLRQNAVFKIFQEKLHSLNIHKHRSTRWLLAKPFKKFPKSPIRPACSHFWQAQNLQWTLKELRFNIRRNLFCLFFI